MSFEFGGSTMTGELHLRSQSPKVDAGLAVMVQRERRRSQKCKCDLSALPNVPEPALKMAWRLGSFIVGVDGTGVIAFGQLHAGHGWAPRRKGALLRKTPPAWRRRIDQSGVMSGFANRPEPEEHA
jgi:hypothetical protein